MTKSFNEWLKLREYNDDDEPRGYGLGPGKGAAIRVPDRFINHDKGANYDLNDEGMGLYNMLKAFGIPFAGDDSPDQFVQHLAGQHQVYLQGPKTHDQAQLFQNLVSILQGLGSGDPRAEAELKRYIDHGWGGDINLPDWMRDKKGGQYRPGGYVPDPKRYGVWTRDADTVSAMKEKHPGRWS
jgi:hypothetical protein